MIRQTVNIQRNRVNVLPPYNALITSDLKIIRYIKSVADTGANRAIWGNSPQIVYLESTPEVLAIVERDKNEPAIVYSEDDYTLTEEERVQLRIMCIDNGVDYLGDMQAIQGLNNIGIAIIKLTEI